MFSIVKAKADSGHYYFQTILLVLLNADKEQQTTLQLTAAHRSQSTLASLLLYATPNTVNNKSVYI